MLFNARLAPAHQYALSGQASQGAAQRDTAAHDAHPHQHQPGLAV